MNVTKYDVIIRRCHLEATGFENVVFIHVFREQNRLADSLAKSALTHTPGFYQYAEVSSDLRDILHEDQSGVTFPR